MTDYDGPERRQGYEELAQRLDDHADHIAARFTKWFRAGLIAFALIGLSVFAALLGVGYAIDEIQNSRSENCRDQNQRHDNTIRQFRIETRRAIRRNPDSADQIRANTAANVRLINTIVPKVNCEKAVQP